MFLYSVVEAELTALCGELRKRHKLPEEQTQRKETPLERYQSFLSVTCSIDFGREPSWEKLTTLEKVRNCIAHTGGVVRDSKDKKFLEQAVKMDIGINIATHPISEGRLDIEPRYCKASTDAAIDFFSTAFDRGGFGPATARVLR